MTYPEYEAKINELVQNPDKLAMAAVDLLKEIKKDTDALAGANEANTKHEARIRELQETNYQLFLRATGDPSTIKPNAAGTAGSSDDMAEHLTARFGPVQEGE